MSLQPETQRGLELLAGGVVVAVARLAWLSHRFTTPQGSGGVTLLLGCVFVTALLWAMLALRDLAADRVSPSLLDDGVLSAAVTAWTIALIPPREANFWPEGGVDDFQRVYVPLSLLVVFIVLGAQRLVPTRTVRSLLIRGGLSLALALLATGVLLALSPRAS